MKDKKMAKNREMIRKPRFFNSFTLMLEIETLGANSIQHSIFEEEKKRSSKLYRFAVIFLIIVMVKGLWIIDKQVDKTRLSTLSIKVYLRFESCILRNSADKRS